MPVWHGRWFDTQVNGPGWLDGVGAIEMAERTSRDMTGMVMQR
jgi:hypothetical protein